MKLLPQRPGLVRLPAREIGLLRKTVAQVEKLDPVVLVGFDKFPVAFTNRAVGRCAAGMLMRVMPVNRDELILLEVGTAGKPAARCPAAKNFGADEPPCMNFELARHSSLTWPVSKQNSQTSDI